MNKIKLAIIGFGNSAKAFSKILKMKNEDISKELNLQVIITAIATATRGNLYNPMGLDLELLIENNNYSNLDDFTTMDTNEIIESANYDILIELTPLNIKHGQPATEYIEKALSRGKHVVTANKGPLANHYHQLKELANEKNAQFLYETTVMDGTPIFNLVSNTLPFCKILGFDGILNTTTNFILEELEKESDFETALQKGKKEGFVEADPINDLAGIDAAAKTAVLANVLLGVDIKPADVDYEGIIGVTSKDILAAKKMNKKLKLICQASIVDGFHASVSLKKLNIDHPLANINGTSSAINIHTDLMGTITIIENNPTIVQTGYGIFSDLITILKGTY